ncbi:MAG: hypothetical protein HOE90_20865 [Bacteriovoracaceae bacterium]|jgi:hypothetical protein|nr:hypothetical protein [Bacteriovoracaceae bacterium]
MTKLSFIVTFLALATSFPGIAEVQVKRSAHVNAKNYQLEYGSNNFAINYFVYKKYVSYNGNCTRGGITLSSGGGVKVWGSTGGSCYKTSFEREGDTPIGIIQVNINIFVEGSLMDGELPALDFYHFVYPLTEHDMIAYTADGLHIKYLGGINLQKSKNQGQRPSGYQIIKSSSHFSYEKSKSIHSVSYTLRPTDFSWINRLLEKKGDYSVSENGKELSFTIPLAKETFYPHFIEIKKGRKLGKGKTLSVNTISHKDFDDESYYGLGDYKVKEIDSESTRVTIGISEVPQKRKVKSYNASIELRIDHRRFIGIPHTLSIFNRWGTFSH